MRQSILIKQKLVEDYTKLANNYNFIGIAHIDKVPANLLQKLRKNREFKIKVTKKCVIQRVFKNLGVDLEDELISKPSALVFGNVNPARVYKLFESECIYVPPKVGSIVEEDIVIPEGETPLTMGPQTAEVIATMKKLGIPVKTVKGKVHIEKETTILKKGEKVTQDIYQVLEALNIKPIKINVKLVLAYEKGLIYTPDVLSIDVEKLKEEISTAYLKAYSLAYNIKYPIKEVIETLISEAKSKAKTLAININYLTKETVEDIIGKAKSIAQSLKEKVKE